MPQKRKQSLAVKTANAGKRQLQAGRSMIASSTRPGDPNLFVSGRWLPIAAAYKAYQARLLKHAGVIGIGLGFERVGGIRTGRPAVVVMVRRKRKQKDLWRRGQTRLPATLRVGSLRVPVDVVQLGRLRRHVAVDAGTSIGVAGTRRLATLGAFAIDASGHSVGITARHFFVGVARQGLNPGVTYPSTLESANAPIIGTYIDGSMAGIDGAIVSVDRPNSVTWKIGGKRIIGWRALSLPADEAASVQMIGAKSGHQFGVVEAFDVCYPRWKIDSAILVHIKSEPGDSGSALLDSAGYVLGILVGQPDASDTLRVFCSIGSILDRLGCDIPFKST